MDKNIYKKQITIKTTCIIVLLTMVASVFSVNTYAIENNGPHLNTFAANYFYGLTNPFDMNLGRNAEDSCGYVAAGMLLSYYDSYWNDNFIDEKYDATGKIDISSYEVEHSPGIKREKDWKTLSGYTNYDDFIDDNADEFFHLKLLQIGRDDLHLCDPTLKDWIDFVFLQRPIDTDWLISMSDVADVIEEYISQLPEEYNNIKNNVTVNYSSFRDAEHILHDNRNKMIRDEMVDKIEDGVPVIYFGYSESTNSGHFMIAYDYDANNDTIYFHTGWESDSSITDKDEELFIYKDNTSILWIDFDDSNFSHEHAFNYLTSDLETAYCACQIYSNHPAHEENHIHNINNIGYDNTHHWNNACHCGKSGPDSVRSLHNLSYTYIEIPSGLHFEECSGCAYKGYANHTYNHQYIEVSDTQHVGVCKCGAQDTVLKAHSRSRCVMQDSISHYVYCICGHLIKEEYHTMVSVNVMSSMCRDCGYTRMNVPGQIIKGIGDEEPVTE